MKKFTGLLLVFWLIWPVNVVFAAFSDATCIYKSSGSFTLGSSGTYAWSLAYDFTFQNDLLTGLVNSSDYSIVQAYSTPSNNLPRIHYFNPTLGTWHTITMTGLPYLKVNLAFKQKWESLPYPVLVGAPNDIYPGGVGCTPYLPPPPCEAQAAALAASCGDVGNIASMDLDTCVGTCVPCTDIADRCTEACGESGVQNFMCTENYTNQSISSLDISTPCTCESNGCDKYKADCYSSYGEYAIFNCTENGAGVANQDHTCTNDDCLESKTLFGNSICGGVEFIETYDCPTNTGTCKSTDCLDHQTKCNEFCKGHVDSFSCDPTTLTKTCTCSDFVNVNNTPPSPNSQGVPSESPEISSPTDTPEQSAQKTTNNTAQIVSNSAISAKTLDIGLGELNQTAKTIAENTRIANEKDKETLENDVLDPVEMGKIGQSMQTQIDTPENQYLQSSVDRINNISTNSPMATSMFDNTLSKLTGIFTSGQCVNMVIPIPKLNKNLVINCSFSEKIKIVLGFLCTLFTIMELIEILYSGVVPKGSPQLKLWG